MGTKSSTVPVRIATTVQRRTEFAPNDGTVSILSRTMFRSRNGQPLTNWKGKIKAGTNSSTPFTATDEITTHKPFRYSSEFTTAPFFGGHHNDFVEGLPPGLTYPSPGQYIGSRIPTDISDVLEEAEAKAIKALYKKIREIHQQFSGGLFLAEIRKTVSSIRKPAVALRELVAKQERAARSIVRKHGSHVATPVGRRDLQKALAGSYLEGVFAWAPLIGDVQDGAKALARLVGGEYRHERFRAFGTAESVEYSDRYLHFGFDLPRSDVLEQGKLVSTVVYYGAFKGVNPSVRLGATAERIVDLSGFHLREFIPTVWEVIPYSFLVDYFVNIGDMLEAASTDTSEVKRVTKVIVNEWVYRMTFKPNFVATASEIATRWGAVQGLQQAGTNGLYEVKTRTVQRIPLSSVPFLKPRFEVPNLFSKHSLNIGALLAGARPPRL